MKIGILLSSAIFLIAIGLGINLWTSQVDNIVFAVTSTIESRIQVGNTAPTVSSVVVNNADPIILLSNDTKAVNVTAILTDNNGCSDIQLNSSTILLYRSGITSSTCNITQNNLNCYKATAFNATSSCNSSTTLNTTTTFNVWYFADATDSSSSYSGQGWKATVTAQDASSSSATADSPAVQMNTLLAITSPTQSINYGSILQGENTSSTNQQAFVQNAGNATNTLLISGTAMTSTSTSDVVPTSSQHYATTTFTFSSTGTEQVLSSTLQTVAGFIISNPLVKFPEVPAWTYTTALPFTDYDHPSFAYNGYAYVVGGVGGDYKTVLYGPISSTGSIAYWTSTTALPFMNYQHPSFAYNGYAYVVGGTGTSTVLFGPISSTGSIAYWTSTTSLPFTNYSHPSFAYNGYVYIVGGWAEGEATSTVLKGPISSTGSIAYWTSTTSLPFADYNHPSFAYNGYAYVVGGIGGDYTIVLYGPISSTGSIAYWTSTASLPFADYNHPSFAYNGYAYVVGGYGGDNKTVLYGPISSTGSIAYWTSTTALPFMNYQHPSFAYNGYAYVVGGVADGAATSTVIFTPLSAKPTYWGAEAPSSTTPATYSGTVTFTAVFSP
jgi:hypothetical protein